MSSTVRWPENIKWMKDVMTAPKPDVFTITLPPVNPKAWLREHSTKTRRVYVTPTAFVDIARPSTAELRRFMHDPATPVVVKKFCYNALRYRRTARNGGRKA